MLFRSMPTKVQHEYIIGDRVAERPKLRGLFTRSPETAQRIAQHRHQRYGTVLGFKSKKDSKGRTINFLIVQWDHLTSPTEHAQMRICPVYLLEELTKQMVVPGE